MADIKTYINQIKNAIYGKDVRSSIVDAIEKVNNDNEAYQTLADDAAAALERANAIVAGKVGIDDTAVSASTTWSSSYLNDSLGKKKDNLYGYGYSSAEATETWYKLASIVAPSSADNRMFTFAITRLYGGASDNYHYNAIVLLNLRWPASAFDSSSSRFYIISSNNDSFALSSYLFVAVDSNNVANIYCRTALTYDGWRIDQIKDVNRRSGISINSDVTYYTYSSATAAGTETSAPSGSILLPLSFNNSGWVELTLLNGFTSYNNSVNNTPKVRKIGEVVELVGEVSPPAENTVGSTTPMVICQLPGGYIPAKGRYSLLQGSSNSIWLLRVETSGQVTASRYRDGATTTTPASTAWMPFNITYLAN